MRLVTFLPLGDTGTEARTGAVSGDEVVDLTAPGAALPGEMNRLLAEPGIAERLEASVRASSRRWSLEEVALQAPVPNPPTVLAIGMNYRRHVAEMGVALAPYQYWFNKQRTCIIGPGEPIVVPSVSEQVDYEGELALVIGRRCRNVPEDRALEVVAGYTVINDVSVRDWQHRTPTFTMGKSFDSHGPLGPWLVTADEIADPGDLRLRTWVNGDLRQDSSTGDMVFGCAELIAYLTSAFTLEPGDVLATGTPAGVAAGRQPPPWLRAGDRVRIEIEGIGTLENPVVEGGAPVPLGLAGG
jgi:2-keto-4-pentenoate hydratase/2-oxohepta-3-ene-1,7-dioic acid hydratase in catechol pathway